MVHGLVRYCPFVNIAQFCLLVSSLFFLLLLPVGFPCHTSIFHFRLFKIAHCIEVIMKNFVVMLNWISGLVGNGGSTQVVDVQPECSDKVGNSRHYLKDVSMALRKVKQKADVQKALAPFEGKLSARDATLVFRMIYNRQVAVEFYKWVKLQPGFEPHFHLFMAFANCLLRVQKWVALEVLVDEMVKSKLPPDGRFYAQVIRAAGNTGRFEIVKKWLSRMEVLGCPYDLEVYNALIEAYGRKGQIGRALFFFKQLKSEGLVPDRATYSAMLCACRQAGKVDEGCHLFEEMQKSGVCPDQWSYSILIDMFGKAGRPKDASNMFQEMQVR